MAPPTESPRIALADLLPAETSAPEETEALGAALAAALVPGDVLALYGDLGSGKTHLVKGLCTALGVPPEDVSSPTFALVHEYRGGDLPLYHIDAYRLETPDAFYELGYEDYVYGDGLCFVEWPERVDELLPAHALRLRLTHLGGNRRRIAWAGDE